MFRCYLELPKVLETSRDAPLEPEDIDNFFVLIIHACELLARAEVRFRIEGFGVADRYLEVDYDLAIFLDQFPDLMAALAEHDEFQLDIFSQGVECAFVFLPVGESIEIRCFSGWSRQPLPEIEKLPRFDFDLMMTTLAEDFAVALRTIDENVAMKEPFPNWIERRVMSRDGRELP